MKLWSKLKHSLSNDPNWSRAARYGSSAIHAAPRRTLQYIFDKFPIIGWLPRYQPRWLLSDIVAGLTLGIMLIPQSLAYAQIADIPVEYDLSTGPTSLIGLLTAEVVHALQNDFPPQAIAAAVAFWMGVYGLMLGLLKLGFLLDFISEPVLTGFISAAAVTIGLGQVDSLLGENDVRDGTANTIHDIFAQLPNANGRAAGVGLAGIVMLVALQHIGQKWGKTNRVAWFAGITRSFTTLVLFTGISYGVNKSFTSETYLFEVSEVSANGIERPMVPSTALLSRSATGAAATFIAAAVEHVTIARAFGARNGYATDASQELTYLGLTNLANGFLGGMGVGGAMSRTAVNSQSGVRSPLSGFVTTAVVLISLYFLSGALYWIPKATLAAIIITAVAPLVGSWRTYYGFWRTSFVDFVAAMLAFWISLFVATEYGIAAGVGWGVLAYLLRLAFANTRVLGSETVVTNEKSLRTGGGMDGSTVIAPDTRVFAFTESVFFPNTTRVKAQLIDGVKTFHAPGYLTPSITASSTEPLSGPTVEAKRNRSWSVVGEKRVVALRKRAGIADPDVLPPIRVLVLDLTRCTYMDSTAMHIFGQVVEEVRRYAGGEIVVKVAAAPAGVLDRFQRAGWVLEDANTQHETRSEGRGGKSVEVCHTLAEALRRERGSSDGSRAG